MDARNGNENFCFDKRFEQLTGHTPLKWQRRLFEKHFMNREGHLPSALDLPTGLGKTSVMAIWYLAWQQGAPVPRRLVYVVDRRAVVDQATTVADRIKERSCNGALRISTLRGQYADNREWLEDPAAPAIIIGTVDMIGSRLLFEGYGVSRWMRPYHAGLLGADTLLVLDESHLVPPFERLLEQIARNHNNAFGPKEKTDRDLIPRFRLLPLSATGGDRDGNVFQLTGEDREDPVVRKRLEAKKYLTFIEPVDDKTLAQKLAKEAQALSDEGKAPVRVLIYCNSRSVAEKTKEALGKWIESKNVPDENIQLFVGARRVKEREEAKNRLEELGFFSGSDTLDKPAFIIATSAGEVGVDLDADHMVIDLVPFERMVQRLGRVNRLGGENREAHIIVLKQPDKDLPDDLKKRARKTAELLRELSPFGDTAFQAGPGAFVQLKEDLKKEGCEQRIRDASSPDPLYPALVRPLVDAWSMTSLTEHTGRPEVQPWLRGWIDNEPPQTTLVWRKFLPVRVQDGEASEREVADFFAATPPHLTEKLETESDRVYDWLKKRLPKAKEQCDSDKFIAFVLDGRNEPKHPPLKLDEEIQNKDKKGFRNLIAGGTMILDARLGGLSKDGLLDGRSNIPVLAADEDGWCIAGEEQPPLIPFRVREVKRDEHEYQVTASDSNWRSVHTFDTERDGEGQPLRQLRVEKYTNATAREEERSLSPKRAQKLKEHQELTARKAEKLVKSLKLPGNIGDAIVRAARLHDEGKKADNWQRAFSANTDDIYAKTTGPFRSTLLANYRHEFGSLAHVEEDDAFKALPDDLKDIVLHLIAAHHGRARPVIGTEGCTDGPPSLLEMRSREVAQRFARLQKRFGPWGLAWLEAILRAADQQASRDLDEGRTPDG